MATIFAGRAELMMESGIFNNVLSFPVLSVGCYTCSSFNNSDPGCSDPFNPAFSTYVHSCKQGKKDRVGLFPATFCIKMDGISCKLIIDCLPGHGLHMMTPHDDVIKWKHFPRHWPFVREIHRCFFFQSHGLFAEFLDVSVETDINGRDFFEHKLYGHF